MCVYAEACYASGVLLSLHFKAGAVHIQGRYALSDVHTCTYMYVYLRVQCILPQHQHTHQAGSAGGCGRSRGGRQILPHPGPTGGDGQAGRQRGDQGESQVPGYVMRL